MLNSWSTRRGDRAIPRLVPTVTAMRRANPEITLWEIGHQLEAMVVRSPRGPARRSPSMIASLLKPAAEGKLRCWEPRDHAGYGAGMSVLDTNLVVGDGVGSLPAGKNDWLSEAERTRLKDLEFGQVWVRFGVDRKAVTMLVRPAETCQSAARGYPSGKRPFLAHLAAPC